MTPRRCWIPACSRRSGPASSGAASPQDTIGAKPEPVRVRLMTSPVTAFIGIVTAGVSSGMNLTMQVGGSSVQVRSRAGTANPPSVEDCGATWQRNRDATSTAKCIRSRGFRPSHVFRLRPTGHRPLPGRTHTGPAAQLRHSAIYQNGCRLNRPTGPIHSKKSQKRISDVRELGNIQSWSAGA